MCRVARIASANYLTSTSAAVKPELLHSESAPWSGRKFISLARFYLAQPAAALALRTRLSYLAVRPSSCFNRPGPGFIRLARLHLLRVRPGRSQPLAVRVSPCDLVRSPWVRFLPHFLGLDPGRVGFFLVSS